MKRLNLGHSDFKNIIEDDNYFIDKSLLVKDVILSQTNVLLLPRPRRFGKTLNLSMLKYFFDKNEPNNAKLFQNLKIWNEADDIKKHCGKYPVIHLTFKDAKEENWEDCYELITNEISKVFAENDYILEGNTLKSYEKKDYEEILTGTASKIKFQKSIDKLTKYLYRYHKQKIVVLIDEYDAPIQAGYQNFYDKVVPFMRNLLSGAFKDNSHLYKGVITGILKVSKESIFSGLNNLGVYSIYSYDFSDKFGFTKDEVRNILADFDLSNKFQHVTRWYGGYKIGNTESIYNPWSILSLITRHEEGFKTFWTNTSSNELIKNEIVKKDAGSIRKDVLRLINRQTIRKDIEDNFVFPNIGENKELLWSLLVYSGYLTIGEQISRKKYQLKIPNYEIKTVFQDTIVEWLHTDVKIQKTLLEKTARYLVTNKIDKFEKGFRQIIGDTFSYYDTSRANEYVYQSYVLGLLAIIGDEYIIKSNKESGKGRYDIMLIPHRKNKFGVIIEIKNIPSKKYPNPTTKQINNEIKKASAQINRNKYHKELLDNQIPEDMIIRVPIVFVGKEPYINLLNEEE